MASSRNDTRPTDRAEPIDRTDRTDGQAEADRGRWRFWIDRGGTFTDLVARSPDGGFATRKLLSENPEAYEDAAIQGIRDFLSLDENEPVPAERIDSVKMGTTVATNALLERAGEPTVLAITRGLKDVLEIGYQARHDIFALNIVKPEQLYDEVIEIDERLHADGSIAVELDEAAATEALQASYERGLRAVAIVLMHSFREGCHENALADIARRIGFEQVSVSHEVTPLIRLVSRGDTSVLDAYLTPILRRYVNRVSTALGADTETGPRLLFMQSSGGLTAADRFQGRDAILSGPAGGIVGAALTSHQAGFGKMIGFDMGGTSTDVSHYAGRYERTFETEVAGVRLRAPMMDIHTVAAGGGSILHYDGSRFLVGPDSAGADPGPRAYRRGGPLTVTDINAALGKIDPDFFPALFGPGQDEPLDVEAARAGFVELAAEVGDGRSWEAVAEGFLTIAIEHMAQAIKKISVERGYAVADYVLTCFGGAGGQHACLVAERLGMDKVLLHPFSGVLSAYGMGLADLSAQSQRMISAPLGADAVEEARRVAEELAGQGAEELSAQGVAAEDRETTVQAMLRYRGSDTAIGVPLADPAPMRERFEREHRTQYGFVDRNKDIVLDYIDVEVKGGGEPITEPGATEAGDTLPERAATTACYLGGAWVDVPVHERDALPAGVRIEGPAIVVEGNGTIVLEPGWSGELTAIGNLVLDRTGEKDGPEQDADKEGTDGEGANGKDTHRANTDKKGAARRSDARARRRSNETRSPSRSSTDCSCRLPSRWGWCSRTPPSRSTSRSASTSPAPSSTRAARWWRTPHTCRCTSARWTRACGRSSTAARRFVPAMPSCTTTPTTAARTCPTSPSSRQCSTTRRSCSSSPRAAATTRTSAASRPAPCHLWPTPSSRRASCSTPCGWSPAASCTRRTSASACRRENIRPAPSIRTSPT